MAIVVLTLQRIMSASGLPPSLILISCIIAGAASYAIVLYLLWAITRPDSAPEKMVIRFLQSRMAGSS